jgi:uncharacterized RDD family membrane protein YckC
MQFHPKDLSELDDLTEEHLGFSALSDGLGFSKSAKKKPLESEVDEDPELQRKSFEGTGAVAAGIARPAPGIYAPPSYQHAYPSASAARAAPTQSAQALAEPAAPRSLRVAAFLVDALIVLLPLAGAWWASFGEDALAIFRQDMAAPAYLFAVIFGAYFLLSESFGGQSLGKMLFGLRVTEDDKYRKPTGLRHAMIRLALFLVGLVALGLGFLASFWDTKRRPWHDRYSGSIVRRTA